MFIVWKLIKSGCFKARSLAIFITKVRVLHRNSTVPRSATKVTSERYGDPKGYDG